MTQIELESRPVGAAAGPGTPHVSVVIPVFDEERTVEEVVRLAARTLGQTRASRSS